MPYVYLSDLQIEVHSAARFVVVHNQDYSFRYGIDYTLVGREPSLDHHEMRAMLQDDRLSLSRTETAELIDSIRYAVLDIVRVA